VELEELGKRLEVLKDIEEIKNLHRDYIYAHNSESWNKMIDCFTDTAVVEIVNSSARGKKEIASLFLDSIAKNEKAKGAHILIQPVITVEGDTAKGHWIMDHFYYDVPGVQKVAWGQGRYYCEYIKKNRKWKFSLLKFTRPWPNPEIKL
jgi:ketosteroid isomerase-like protein